MQLAHHGMLIFAVADLGFFFWGGGLPSNRNNIIELADLVLLAKCTFKGSSCTIKGK